MHSLGSNKFPLANGVPHRTLAAAALFLGLATSGCTGWPGPYVGVGHFSDNPFDLAVKNDEFGRIRQRLFKRHPIGRPTREMRKYLQRIGASCADGKSGLVICQYSQFQLLGDRGLIGDNMREYVFWDFTIRLIPGQGPLRDVSVCATITGEVETNGPIFGKPDRPRVGKFKPCDWSGI